MHINNKEEDTFLLTSKMSLAVSLNKEYYFEVDKHSKSSNPSNKNNKNSSEALSGGNRSV